jgi:transcriptional regulator with XRE-family HTH domain
LQRGWVVSPDYRALIDALSLCRKRLGVSQRELARRIGKPPSFVNKIELFERRMDILEFVVIAKALEQEPGKLLMQLSSQLPLVIEL